MPFQPRNTFVPELVPEDCACVFVETEQTPLVPLIFLIRISSAIEADLEIRFCARPDGSRQIELVPPDDGTGVREAWDRSMPANVFVGFQIPGQRRATFRNAARLRPAKLRPIHADSGKTFVIQ